MRPASFQARNVAGGCASRPGCGSASGRCDRCAAGATTLPSGGCLRRGRASRPWSRGRLRRAGRSPRAARRSSPRHGRTSASCRAPCRRHRGARRRRREGARTRATPVRGRSRRRCRSRSPAALRGSRESGGCSSSRRSGVGCGRRAARRRRARAAAAPTSCRRDGPLASRSSAASLMALPARGAPAASRARAAPAGGRRRRLRVDRDRAQARAEVAVAKMKSQANGSGHWSRRGRRSSAAAPGRVEALPGVVEGGTRGIVERRGHARVQRVVGAEVEVAGEDRRDRLRLAPGTGRRHRSARGRRGRGRRPRRGARAAPRPAPRAGLRVVLEVRRHHAERPERRLRRRPRAASAACCAPPVGRPRQLMAQHLRTGRRVRIMLPKRRRVPSGRRRRPARRRSR